MCYYFLVVLSNINKFVQYYQASVHFPPTSAVDKFQLQQEYKILGTLRTDPGAAR